MKGLVLMSAKLWKISKIGAVLLCTIIAFVGIPSIPLYILGVEDAGYINTTSPAAISVAEDDLEIEPDNPGLDHGSVPSVDIEKFVSTTNLVVDRTVDYTIVITNTGNAPLEDLEVEVDLPRRAANVDGTLILPPGATGRFWGPMEEESGIDAGTWPNKSLLASLATLNVGESVTISLTMRLDVTTHAGVIRTNATVASAIHEINRSTDAAFTFEPNPQIEIFKNIEHINTPLGRRIMYTLGVINTGNVLLTDVLLNAVIDDRLVLHPLYSGVFWDENFLWTLNETECNNEVQAFLSGLSPGTARGFMLSLVVPDDVDPQTLTINISVTANALGGEVQVTDTLVSDVLPDGPAVHIQQSIETASLEADSIVRHMVDISNTGNVPLTDLVVIVPTLPRFAAVLDSLILPDGAIGHFELAYDAEYGDWPRILQSYVLIVNLDMLPVGESVSLSFEANETRYTHGGTWWSNAQVTSAAHGLSENANASATIAASPGLELRKTARYFSAQSQVLYTLQISNTGNVDLTNIVVTDTVSSLLTVTDVHLLTSREIELPVTGNDVVVNMGWLPIGAGVSIEIWADVPEGLPAQTVVNTAGVTAIAAGIELEATDTATFDIIGSQPSNAGISVEKRVLRLYEDNSYDWIPAPTSHVNFYIRITNTGDVTLTDLVLESILPAAYTGVTFAGQGLPPGSVNNSEGTHINIALAPLAPGEAVWLSFDGIFPPRLEHGDVPTTVSVRSLIGGLEVQETVMLPISDWIPGIELQKTVYPTVVTPGDTVTYTLTVFNRGTMGIGAVMTDVIDPRLTDVTISHSAAPGILNSSVGNFMHFEMGLPIGGYQEFVITARVPVDMPPGIVSNTATATAVTPLSHRDITVTDIANFEVVASTSAGVSIQKTADRVFVDDSNTHRATLAAVEYAIRITNTGNVLLTDLVVTDVVAAQLTNIIFGALPAGAENNSSGNTVVVLLAPLAPGEYVEIRFGASVPANMPTGSLSNTAMVRSVEHSLEEHDTAIIIVPERPLLEIEKTASEIEVVPGQVVRYTVRVSNIGNILLTDILITDILPAQLTNPQILTLPPGAVGGFTGNLLNVVLPTIEVGQALEITYEATVSANTTPGAIINHAVMRSQAFDIVSEDSAAVMVLPIADVSLNTSAARSGSNMVTYVMRITNIGNIPLTDLVLSNLLPAGITQPQIISLPAGAIGGFAGQLLAINLAAIAPGAIVEIIFSAVPTSGAMISPTSISSIANDIANNENTNFAAPAPPPATNPGSNATGGGNNNSSSNNSSGSTVGTVPRRTVPAPAINTPPPLVTGGTSHAFMVGFPDGTVRPQGLMTRAEIATLFFRLFTDEYRASVWSQTNSFPDVTLHDWFNNAVSTVANAGIIDGIPMPNGNFEPNRLMTRAEFAAIASRFMDVTATTANVFPDVEGHWAAEYINSLSRFGWITGYPDGTFRPDQNMTRAEVAALINRMLERRPRSTEDLLPGMQVWTDNQNINAWYYLDIQEATNSNAFVINEDGSKTWTRLITPRQWTALERPTSTPNSVVYSW